LTSPFLLVSLLTFRGPPTTAQLSVASINATEGEDVLLLVLNLPENLVGYGWYRGESTDSNRVIATYVKHSQEFTPGPAHSGREIIHPNGSLLLQNITLKDTGYYTVQAIKKTFQNEEAKGHLRVYQPVGKPFIRARNTTVTEHKDTVVLTCLTNDTGISIWWFFRDQSLLLTERTKLSRDNSTLIIEPVRREDAGSYQCEVSNPVSASKSDPFRLGVQYVLTSPSLGISGGAIAGIVIGVLAVVALTAALVYFLYIKKTGGFTLTTHLTRSMNLKNLPLTSMPKS
ncbi:carcinoembryonic antigen-related cell adhesion molecule 1-like, partial [Sturnira hondurensis]|uniref:carcinoembryonic antigen-related cell adhesion molecule 1-like n=1 Tax=Sturnira hondurensis TaxID=192404 RepID=UPI00187A70B2